MSQNERLQIVPVPSLVATLLRAERDKGEPLTEAEVLEIRDKCPSVAMTDEMLAKVVARRGYDDIDPENAWEEWPEPSGSVHHRIATLGLVVE